MRKTPRRRIAVIVHQTVPWIAECITGIRRYAAENTNWQILSLPPSFRRFGYAPTFPDIRRWKGDGIIGAVDHEPELRAAARLGVPMVNLSSWLPDSFGVPRVMVNHRRGGQLAAEHLLQLGLRHLAVFGWKDAWYLQQRFGGFCERAAQAGIACHQHLKTSLSEERKSWYQRIAELARWLNSLPRPCGVFAVHDYLAQLISEACHEAGLRMPEDIALIGMDNDENIARHLVPPLSSVSRNSEQVGWQAAALLDRLIRGAAVPSADRFVEPGSVVARPSTEKLFSTDSVVQRALDEMREKLATPFNIAELAERLGVSKRTLEMRFREHLQSSPHGFLRRLRVQRAQKLLGEPGKHLIESVARECGFGSVQAFREAFRLVTGGTLASFRKGNGDSNISRDLFPGEE